MRVPVPNRSQGYQVIAWTLIVSIGLSLFGSIAAYISRFHHLPVGNPHDWSEFGQYISGLVGTAAAVGALVGLAYTLHLQASELEKSRRLLATQTQTLHKQLFEDTFFRLLQQFIDITDRANREKVFSALNSATAQKFSLWLSVDREHPHTALLTAYDRTYPDAEETVGPFFRLLFHLIKLVRNAGLTEEEENRYTSIVRAVLGPNPLVALFINVTAGKEGQTGLKPWVEHFGMLKHLHTDQLPVELRPYKESWLDPDAFRSYEQRKAHRSVSG